MIVIPDLNINALTIGGGAPLDTSQRTAWPNRCAPNDIAVVRVKCPVNAALLPETDNISQEIGASSSEVEILTGRYRTVRILPGRSQTCACPRVKPCSFFAHLIRPVFRSNARAVSK